MAKQFIQLYADTRGVYRVYQMSFQNGVWKVWRNARVSRNVSWEPSVTTATPFQAPGKLRRTVQLGTVTLS